jgi:hypothetical protein
MPVIHCLIDSWEIAAETAGQPLDTLGPQMSDVREKERSLRKHPIET